MFLFLLGLPSSSGGSQYIQRLNGALAEQGLTRSDTLDILAASGQYEKEIDPAKITRLSQQGAESARGFVTQNDIDGGANFVKSCISTFKELGK